MKLTEDQLIKAIAKAHKNSKNKKFFDKEPYSGLIKVAILAGYASIAEGNADLTGVVKGSFMLGYQIAKAEEKLKKGKK